MTPSDFFAALHASAQTACGARLFTITILNRAEGVAWRAYTSHPTDYPVTGTKPMTPNNWSRLVLEEGQTFVANSTDAFALYFSDHALINALGCEAAINIPVSDGTRVRGTVNILDKAGHFDPECVTNLENLVESARSELLQAFDTLTQERTA